MLTASSKIKIKVNTYIKSIALLDIATQPFYLHIYLLFYYTDGICICKLQFTTPSDAPPTLTKALMFCCAYSPIKCSFTRTYLDREINTHIIERVVTHFKNTAQRHIQLTVRFWVDAEVLSAQENSMQYKLNNSNIVRFIYHVSDMVRYLNWKLLLSPFALSVFSLLCWKSENGNVDFIPLR